MNKRNNRNAKRGKSRDFNSREESKGFEACTDKTTKSTRKGGTRSPGNNPMWYAQSTQLLNDSASLSYSWPLGNEIDLGYGEASNTNRGSAYLNNAVPGIMSFEIVPGIGYSDNNVSPINIAANNFYSYIRHANSGHANYDSPDLMLYLIAMDSAYYMLSYLQRTYGIISSYSQENRYFGRALVTAAGFDYEDLLSNLANFRTFLNVYAVRVGSMCVPSGMSYYLRHSQLFSGIYMEEPTAKTQMYLCNPAGYYTYDEMTSDKGGYLKWNLINSNVAEGSTRALKFSDIVELCNAIINPIIASEDLNIMSGDILKAYGEGGVLKVGEIGEAFSIVPTVDVMFLNQLKNSHITTVRYLDQTSLNIKQDPDNLAIIYTPHTDVPNFEKALITTDATTVTPAMTMEWSRLQTMTGERNDSGKYPINHLGSEFVSRVLVWSFGFEPKLNVTDSDLTPDKWKPYAVEINSTQTIIQQLPDELTAGNIYSMYKSGLKTLCIQMEKISSLSKFKYHPRFECGIVIEPRSHELMTETKGTYLPAMFFDIDNYTIVDKHTMDKMNLTALLSEFDCPQMGKLNKV